MIEKKETEHKTEGRGWIFYAILSAVFASLTSILGKIGIEGVESNLGTAIRTGVVLCMAWGIVFLKNKQRLVKQIPNKERRMIYLSGLPWLCYYKALRDGLAGVVVPIDKLSIVVTIVFSYIVFHEKLSRKALFGLVLIIGGTSLAVYPAAGLIDYFRGEHLVVINKSPTPRDRYADLLIQGPIGQVFSQIHC